MSSWWRRVVLLPDFLSGVQFRFLSLFVALWNSLKRAAQTLPSLARQVLRHKFMSDTPTQREGAWKVIKNWVKWHMRAGIKQFGPLQRRQIKRFVQTSTQ